MNSVQKPQNLAIVPRVSIWVPLLVSVFLLFFLLFVVWSLGPRPHFEFDQYRIPEAPALELPPDFMTNPEAFLGRIDAEAELKDDLCRSRLRWVSGPGVQTDLSIVYLHGFSASPLDLHPTLDLVAESLNANLFQMRMRGHGLKGTGLGMATAEQWMEDARIARLVGEKIGKRVLFVGMSTGATLALLGALENQKKLFGLALLSPNFGVTNSFASLLTYPWGTFLARLVTGNAEHSWVAETSLREKLWTTRYKLEAAAQMQAVVDVAQDVHLNSLKVPVLVVHSKQDLVVKIENILQKFSEMGSELKGRVVLEGSSRHELAGNAIDPTLSAPLADLISAYFQNVILTERNQN